MCKPPSSMSVTDPPWPNPAPSPDGSDRGFAPAETLPDAFAPTLAQLRRCDSTFAVQLAVWISDRSMTGITVLLSMPVFWGTSAVQHRKQHCQHQSRRRKLGRPPLSSASYIAEKRASILMRASLSQERMGRSGRLAGTNSSSRMVVNNASL